MPAGKVKRQTLDKSLEFHFSRAGLRSAHHRAERVHHNDTGVVSLDLFNDFLKDGVQVLFENELAKIDEANCAIQFGLVEEGELLLIAQHLDRGFAQNREVQRWPLAVGVGEHELMH